MRIRRVEVFGYDLHYVHGDYVMSGGRRVSALSSTAVCLTADDGTEGWAEVCPLGPTYLPAFADGARAALRVLAPALLGAEPTNLGRVHQAMDAALRGHEYARSPLDIACWDLLGKAAGLPVVALLGGRRLDRYPLYMAVPLGSPAEMAAYAAARRAEGIHRFQLKIGGPPAEDAERVRAVVEATGADDIIIADANGGWRVQDAVVAARLLEPFPRLYLEQPCPTIEECAAVLARTTLPMIYDEVVVDVPSLIRAVREGGAGGINLKISRVGGLTKARLLREAAEAMGVSLTIEDMWGGDLTTAAVSHLAAAADPALLFTVSFMNDWTKEHVAGYQPRSAGGFGAAPERPGLGIEVDRRMLGTPLFAAE